MSIVLDHEKRRMTVTAVPGFAGAVVSRAIADLIRGDARIASYDFVMDVRDSDSGSTMEDFRTVQTAYSEAARQAGLKYGCFVSTDVAYRYWAAAIADMFGDRSCPVFMTVEAAHAFLDAQRALIGA